jgi:hypothetical protein
MNKTIQHLAEICKEHRFKEKLLFVPSYSKATRSAKTLRSCCWSDQDGGFQIAVEVTEIGTERGLRTSSSASRPDFMQRTELWGEED